MFMSPQEKLTYHTIFHPHFPVFHLGASKVPPNKWCCGCWSSRNEQNEVSRMNTCCNGVIVQVGENRTLTMCEGFCGSLSSVLQKHISWLSKTQKIKNKVTVC